MSYSAHGVSEVPRVSPRVSDTVSQLPGVSEVSRVSEVPRVPRVSEIPRVSDGVSGVLVQAQRDLHSFCSGTKRCMVVKH